MAARLGAHDDSLAVGSSVQTNNNQIGENAYFISGSINNSNFNFGTGDRNQAKPEASNQAALRQRVLQALHNFSGVSDIRVVKNIKGTPTAGTCEWIFRTPKYRRWLESKGSHLLWISGGAGKGKPILAIHLVDCLNGRIAKAGKQPSQHSAQAAQYVVVHHFCGSTAQSGIEATICSLLVQLYQQSERLLDDAITTFSDLKLLGGNDAKWLHRNEVAKDTLWTWFKHAFTGQQAPLETVYCVLDGLDECDSPSRQFLSSRLMKLGAGTGAQDDDRLSLKMIIVSQDLPELNHLDAERLSLEDDTYGRLIQKDVGQYISVSVDELAEKVKGLSPKDVEYLKSKLKAHSEVTFLWISIFFSELDNLGPTTTRKDIFERLMSLPDRLGQQYGRFLTRALRLPGISQKDVTGVLQWVVWAARDLTVAELAEAVACTNDTNESRDRIRKVVEALHPLLQTRRLGDTTGVAVQFVHQTAKQYLLEPQGQQDEEDLTETTRAILRVLRGPLKDFRWRQTKACADVLAGPNQLPLFRYASHYWVEHLRIFTSHSDIEDLDELDRHPFFGPVSRARDNWCYALNRLGLPFIEEFVSLCRPNYQKRDGLCEDQAEIYPERHAGRRVPRGRLCIASFFGLTKWAMIILQQRYPFQYMSGSTLIARAARMACHLPGCSPPEWNVADDKQFALGWAIVRGHTDIVQLLLKEYNVNVERPLWDAGDTPLRVAVALGHVEVAKALLKAGAIIADVEETLFSAVDSLYMLRLLFQHLEISEDKGASPRPGRLLLKGQFALLEKVGKFYRPALMEFLIDVGLFRIDPFEKLCRLIRYGHSSVLEVVLRRQSSLINTTEKAVQVLTCAMESNNRSRLSFVFDCLSFAPTSPNSKRVEGGLCGALLVGTLKDIKALLANGVVMEHCVDYTLHGLSGVVHALQLMGLEDEQNTGLYGANLTPLVEWATGLLGDQSRGGNPKARTDDLCNMNVFGNTNIFRSHCRLRNVTIFGEVNIFGSCTKIMDNTKIFGIVNIVDDDLNLQTESKIFGSINTFGDLTKFYIASVFGSTNIFGNNAALHSGAGVIGGTNIFGSGFCMDAVAKVFGSTNTFGNNAALHFGAGVIGGTNEFGSGLFVGGIANVIGGNMNTFGNNAKLRYAAGVIGGSNKFGSGLFVDSGAKVIGNMNTFGSNTVVACPDSVFDSVNVPRGTPRWDGLIDGLRDGLRLLENLPDESESEERNLKTADGLSKRETPDAEPEDGIATSSAMKYAECLSRGEEVVDEELKGGEMQHSLKATLEELWSVLDAEEKRLDRLRQREGIAPSRRRSRRRDDLRDVGYGASNTTAAVDWGLVWFA